MRKLPFDSTIPSDKYLAPRHGVDDGGSSFPLLTTDLQLLWQDTRRVTEVDDFPGAGNSTIESSSMVNWCDGIATKNEPGFDMWTFQIRSYVKHRTLSESFYADSV